MTNSSGSAKTSVAHTQQSLLDVDVQHALSKQEFNEAEEPPSDQQLIEWANRAYAQVNDQHSEMTIRLVDQEEITALNRDYRQKDKPTNVLSFPVENEFEELDLDFNLLGDVIICHQVIVTQAQQQNKHVQDHYAHMVTHGVLHLCGYDHQDDPTAEQMEALEIQILAQSSIANPYL